MNTILLITLLTAALAIVLAFTRQSQTANSKPAARSARPFWDLGVGIWNLRAKRALTPLANIGEGAWRGRKTYMSSTPLAERYLLGALGADPAHIVAAGETDIPIGVITDESSGDGSPVNVNLLGTIDETQLMVAAVPITAGDFLVPAAAGRVQPMPAAAGKYNVVGRALTTAPAAGELVVADPCPHQRAV